MALVVGINCRRNDNYLYTVFQCDWRIRGICHRGLKKGTMIRDQSRPQFTMHVSESTIYAWVASMERDKIGVHGDGSPPESDSVQEQKT